MRAAVFVEQDAPFVVEEVQLHPCADDEVVVRTGGAAFCITDCHMQHGHLPVVPPAILGPQRGRRGRAGRRARRAGPRRRAGDRPGHPGVRALLLLRPASLRPVRAPRRRAAALRRDARGRHGGARGRDGDVRGADQGAGGVRVRRRLRPAGRAARAHGLRGGVGAGRGDARRGGAAGLVRRRRRLRAPRALDDPGGARRRRGAGHRRRAAPRAAGAGRRARSDGPRRPRPTATRSSRYAR